MKGPNAAQRLLHRFVMLRPVTAFFAPWVHHLDKAVSSLTGGKYAISRILGWDIIQLTTIGAKTRRRRTMPLVGVFDGGKIAVIASNFGRELNPGWYYNLKQHPECDVLFNGRSEMYIAREMDGDEYQHYWEVALSYYEGYKKYKERAVPRHIPVLLLEPKK